MLCIRNGVLVKPEAALRCVSRLYKNGISDKLQKPIKADQSVSGHRTARTYTPGYSFIEDELIEAMGYPNQKYILRPIGNELGNLQKGSGAVKTIEIRGANAYQNFSKTRVGCRGIVIKDSLMLISHEINTGWYLIPGGGLEDGETTEECCVREIREETGYIVKPVFHL